MFTLPQRVSYRWLARGLLVAATAAAVRDAQARPAPQSRPGQQSGSRAIAGDDTAMVHRELRKSIEKFQNKWRSTWQKVEIKRHGFINLSNIRGWPVRSDGLILEPVWQGDRDAWNFTPELRRYLAILCNVDSPTDQQIEFTKARKGNDIGSERGLKAAPIGINALGARTTKKFVGFNRDVSFVTTRTIEPSPNYGAVCPSWTPPDERLPLDEGESIDLALPPNSREPLRRDREQLIAVLTAAQATYPNDVWISGQRLRFILDQRSPNRAVEAARACQGSVTACTSLMGLAQDHAGNVVKAEAAYRFVDSIANIPTATDTAPCVNAETWLLIRPGDRGNLQRKSCAEQRAFVERMWWLADPLWSVPGNERYVQHESRRVHASLRAVMDRDERYVWSRLGGGDAMRELVVRYGWPGYTYWPGGTFEEEISKIREDPSHPRLALPPYTAKEYSIDRTALLPSVSGIQNPFDLTPDQWSLHLPEGTDPDSWWPQEHMMLWTKLMPLAPGQQGQWRRDSTILFSMAVDNALHGLDTAATGPSKAMLVGSTDAHSITPFFAAPVAEGQTLRMHAEFPSRPFVMSAEILARTQREPARRLRYGLRPPPSLREMKAGEVALSDPVFLTVPSRDVVLPNNLSAASVFMAGTTDFTRSDLLALYWESYGFAPTDSVTFELRINRREERNVARAIGSALGLVSALKDSVSIKWSEPDARNGASIIAGAKPIIGRSVAVDLKSLPAGTYVATIEMRRGATTARSERKFTLRN